MTLVEGRMESLEEYEQVSIGFWSRERLDLKALREEGRLVARPCTPFWKDYDECWEDRPSVLPKRFDVANWGVLSAFESGERVGGAILAHRSPGLDMLEGRSDLALIMDVRVREDCRGRGVGRGLFQAAEDWARRRSCRELNVETQDTNVPACRFYVTMGCTLKSAQEHGYPGWSDEAKIVWMKTL